MILGTVSTDASITTVIHENKTILVYNITLDNSREWTTGYLVHKKNSKIYNNIDELEAKEISMT